MVRKTTILIAASILAAILSGPTLCQAGGVKADALKQLIKAPKSQLAKCASDIAGANPKEAAQLELDLIFYRWACHLSGERADVQDIDIIIPALSKELNDQTINWAVAYFTTKQDNTVASQPARDDDRQPALSDLNFQFRSARTDKDSSSVEAVTALNNALKICQGLLLDLSEALLRKQLGDHYLEMALYRDAEVHYESASWTFGAYDCIASTATVYDDLGALSSLSGRPTGTLDASENYKKAAHYWEMLVTPGGYAYRDLVGREYMRAGAAVADRDFNTARQLMIQHGLMELRTWAHKAKSYGSLIANFIEVARLDREHGLNNEAILLLEEAKTACTVQRDPLLSAKVYEDLAKSYTAPAQAQNRYAATQKRDHILREAASACEAAIGKVESPNLSSASRANLYKKIEWGAKSYQELKNYARAAAIWKKMADVYGRAQLTEAQVQAMRSLASMLDLQRKPRESVEVRRAAGRFAMNANKPKLAAEMVHEMVQASVEANDLPNALEGFTEWKDFVALSGNARGVARILEDRAELLVKNRLYDDAIADYGDARARYLSQQIVDPWAAGNVSVKLAAAQRLANKPEDSLTTLVTAMDDIETKYGPDSLRAEAGGIRSQVLVGVYRDLIAAYIIAGTSEKADTMVRKAKRYQLAADLVRELKSSSDRAVGAYANKIDLLPAVEPVTVSLPTTVKPLAEDVFGFWDTCTTLENRHQSSYRALPIDPKSLAKSRASIPRDTLVVEYMTTETGTDIFVCGYDKTICREISLSRDAVGKNVTSLRKVLKGCEDSLGAGIPVPQITDWQETSFLQIKEPLTALYNQLIGPVAKDIDKRTRLIFVLPGEFAGLPMHALISSGADKTPKFLLEDYEISYLGKGMLDDLTNKDNRAIDSSSDRLAIFANPEGNLPGAYAEARTIRGLYMNADRWCIEKEATVSNFLKECAIANIVHIAAHHTIDPNPANFSLTLAPDGKSDGIVGMRDLLGVTNPNLRLVVLSACDAMGSSDPISSGSAMAAEAFSQIGAKSVVGGLWKVSDEVASRIMGDFYRNLKAGAQSRTQALRGAQTNVIKAKQFAHPFYWACFALYGNPR